MRKTAHPDGLIVAKLGAKGGFCLFCEERFPAIRCKPRVICGKAGCVAAYNAAWRRDNRPARRKEETPAERLLKRTQVTDGCWNWLGSVGKAGYGQISFAGQRRSTHRLAYETFVGPIPLGLQLDHLCRNKRCLRPDHLEPVTPQVNVLRGVSQPALNAVKTHCLRDHPLFGANLLMVGKRRTCRACKRIWSFNNKPVTYRRGPYRRADSL